MHASRPEALSCTRRTTAAILLATLLSIPVLARATPQGVEGFDLTAWNTLKTGVRKPTVVVFTATYCAHCPAVFDQVARAIAQKQLNMDLLGVVMDRSPGDDDAALLANAHYKQTARLFAFDGQAQALRYAVDPKWRGVTPYIAVLSPKRPPRILIGMPSDQAVLGWAQP